MLKVLYWLLVLAVSIVLVVALILVLEARDDPDVEGGAGGVAAVMGRA